MKTIIVAAFAALGASAAAAADGPIEVTTSPGAFASEAEARALISSALRGAEARFEYADPANGIIRLEGGEAAARALRADPVFLSVQAEAVEPRHPRLFSILIGEGGMDVAAEPQGRGDRLETEPSGWPGEFVRVTARSEAGDVLAEGYVRDPRFIRHEGWNEDGSHQAGSNHAFVDDGQPLDIWVELPAETARIEVVAPARPDIRQPERTLGAATVELEDAR